MVVGQKADMSHERVITETDGQRFADANGLSFIETSAGEWILKHFRKSMLNLDNNLFEHKTFRQACMNKCNFNNTSSEFSGILLYLHLLALSNEPSLESKLYYGDYIVIIHINQQFAFCSMWPIVLPTFRSNSTINLVSCVSVTGHNVDRAFKMLAQQIYGMMKDGRLHMMKGWDGIKQGYGSEAPQENFQINDNQQSKGGCCSL